MSGDDDTLSVRSMDSSRDEMIDSRPYGMPKPAVEAPFRLEGVTEGMRGCSATQFRNDKGLNGYATVIDTPSGEEEILQPNEDWLDQFAVIVKKKRNAHASGGTEVEALRVRSPLLKAVLAEHLAAYPDFSNGKSLFGMYFTAPFYPLFHCWDTIVNLKEEHADPATRDHLRILHDILVKRFEQPLKRLEECRLTGRITYNSLWTIFKPGELIYSKDKLGNEHLVKLEFADYGFDKDNVACFLIDGHIVCWDGKRFGRAVHREELYNLGKVTDITELSWMPLDLHPDREAIRARVLKRGKKYAKLTKTELKVFAGTKGEANNYGSIKQTDDTPQIWLNARDRVMINPFGLGCPIAARNLDPLIPENPFNKPSIEPLPEASLPSPGSLRHRRDRNYVTDLRKAREKWEKSRNVDTRSDMLTEEQLLITNPIVPYFDLTRKTWSSISVDELNDVEWNENAYDDLIFPDDVKELLLSLAKGSITPEGDIDAILDKKGNGTTICLNGPSGAGKVSLVKAIAEKLHMPLYVTDVVDVIRVDEDKFAKQVENNLLNALERSAKWNAILLIKNIDFTLGKDLKEYKSSMYDYVAMIVHHLADYPGLIFFTTEDVSAIDSHLLAHIDLTLEIPALDASSRRKLWESAITQGFPLQQRFFERGDLDKLAEAELSAREIRGVCRMAGMVAKGKDEGLKMGCLERLIAVKGREKGMMEKKREEGEE